MQTILTFLAKSPILFLATIGEDGAPKNRPFRFLREEQGQLLFGTGRSKAVFREISHNPQVEFSGLASDFSWARISGTVQLIEDAELKTTILDENEDLKEAYQSAENPEFILFTLKTGRAIVYDSALEDGIYVIGY